MKLNDTMQKGLFLLGISFLFLLAKPFLSTPTYNDLINVEGKVSKITYHTYKANVIEIDIDHEGQEANLCMPYRWSSLDAIHVGGRVNARGYAPLINRCDYQIAQISFDGNMLVTYKEFIHAEGKSDDFLLHFIIFPAMIIGLIMFFSSFSKKKHPRLNK